MQQKSLARLVHFVYGILAHLSFGWKRHDLHSLLNGRELPQLTHDWWWRSDHKREGFLNCSKSPSQGWSTSYMEFWRKVFLFHVFPATRCLGKDCVVNGERKNKRGESAKKTKLIVPLVAKWWLTVLIKFKMRCSQGYYGFC